MKYILVYFVMGMTTLVMVYHLKGAPPSRVVDFLAILLWPIVLLILLLDRDEV